MQTHFQRATRHLADDDIVVSPVSPLHGFILPPVIETFYRQVEQQQTKRGNDVAGGFAFGGMFADIAAGRGAKDFDLYIAVPKLLTKLTARSEEPVYSYRDRQEREDDINAIIGYNFPLDIDAMDLHPQRADLFGSYIVGRMQFTNQGQEAVLDVILGQEPLPLKDFLPHVDAPIMAIGATLGGAETEFAYHKNYVSHLKSGILCHDNPTPVLREKAERKNWTILSNAEWAERGSQPGRRADDASPVCAPV